MKNPFVVGGWVRGERFFGREALLREILGGERSFVWVLGTRRIGKTSLLKQLEYLTTEGPDAGPWMPLYWDMQGSHDLAGLREGLLESVEAVADRLAEAGVQPGEIESQDLFGILRVLKRRARERGLQLLLLCDECEELINIERGTPEALPRLRRVFQEGESVRTVLTATKRLGLLERSSVPDTSPFLHGFVPPLYLARLEPEEAAKLIQQVPADAATVRELQARTDCHPYLLQLLCKRLHETGDLPAVIEDLAADDIVSHFFAVDYEYLSPAEKQVLLYVAQTRSASSHDLGAQLGVTASQASTLIHGLQRLGYIRQEAGVCCIPSWFFERWLRQEHGIEVDAVGSSVAGAESQPAFDAESSLELLRRAHGGDRAALLRLCERYHAAFRRWAEGRLPHSVRGQLDTEDLLRETLFGALTQLEAQREGDLWEHLRQELLHRIRDEIGRREPGAGADPEALSSACPQEEVVGRAELRRYEAALARLAPEERQAIVTRIEMGCDYEQVAEALGKPSSGAARMAVCRALVHLAREMSHA